MRAMSTVTKKDLIDRIAEATGQRRVVVKETVQSFLDEIVGELGKGNRLEFRDFGVFETKERAARIAQNPKTLAKVQVPAKSTVRFKVGRKMQAAVDDLDRGTPPPSTAGAGTEGGPSGGSDGSGGAAGDVEAKPTTPASVG
ncbi:MAG: HU family DNA-binding protein [Planctomycetota bacterium]